MCGCKETERESDGLAKSSRNRYLSALERQNAPILYKALQLIQATYTRDKNTDCKSLIALASHLISKESQVTLDYLSIADPNTLQELQVIQKNAILSGAIRVGKTRIIDNILLGMSVDEL